MSEPVPPSPAPKPQSPAPKVAAAAANRIRRPIVVAPDTSKRDTVIAIVCGAVVLSLVLAGIFFLHDQQGKPSRNQLTGVIVAKHDSGEREKEISFGKKGLKTGEADTGFSFEIRVESENRTYEVPVNEGLYRSKKVGETQSFIRPQSEQR